MYIDSGLRDQTNNSLNEEKHHCLFVSKMAKAWHLLITTVHIFLSWSSENTSLVIHGTKQAKQFQHSEWIYYATSPLEHPILSTISPSDYLAHFSLLRGYG